MLLKFGIEIPSSGEFRLDEAEGHPLWLLQIRTTNLISSWPRQELP